MDALNQLKIAVRLPAIVVVMLVIAITAVSTVAYFEGRSSVQEQVTANLEAALTSRQSELSAYISSIQEDLSITAASGYTRDALAAFTAGYNEFSSAEGQLKSLYINNNFNPVGEKDKLNDAGDGSAYSASHAKYHPWFHKLQQDRGYYDVFLFDTNGNLVYTVFKEQDYATNVVRGQYAGTDLGNAFRAALQSPGQSFFDFKPYAPSNDAPASFMSQAIRGENGATVGVLVFQMPVDRINAVMQKSAGLGLSGETYLVGSDNLMRSDSRFSSNSTILSTSITGEAVTGGLAGRTGIAFVETAAGVDVIAAYSSLEILGTTWAIIAQMDVAEMNASSSSMAWFMSIVAVLFIAVFGGAGFYLARTIATPIDQMAGVMTALAGGNHDIDVPYTNLRDEIGTMAGALSVFRDAAKEQAVMRETEKEKLVEAADFSGQLAAISKAQAVIEFNMDGTIITANANFLGAMGYTLEEVQGKHHSMFAEPAYAGSDEYKAFWEKLNRGEYEAAEYKRLGKGGKEVWIQASYNPILNMDGVPFKVVKYATDITAQKMLMVENARIRTALDGATTNVMLADNDFNIIYMNKTMVEMMKNAEADIKKELPNFSADNLMGTNVDVFHKNPAYQRGMVEQLKGAFDGQITIGVRTFGLIANPVLNSDGERLGTSVEWEDRTDRLNAEAEASQIAETNARLKSALDGAQVNVMLADNDFNIIYMNETMVTMMKDAEEDIKVDLPNFVADELMGFNIDGFHTKPSHQRKMVGELDGPFETSIKIGVRTFNLIANPVKGADGTRLGTCVEWDDITEKLKAADAEAAIAATNARLKSALDGAQVNVMLADNDFNIIYMNETMVKMMENAEADIQVDLPNFVAAELMGFNIDGFHTKPSHQRKMVGDLDGTFATSIKIGVRTFDLIANPVKDEDGTRLGTCVEWDDITEKLKAADAEAAIAATNARLKSALDGAQVNVMLADNDFNIIYMNETMVKMMKTAEEDIKKQLKNFDADNLMGFNIDGFHVDPSHQRKMVGALDGPFETSIKIGVRTFDLIANPVMDDEGTRLGTCVEWDDITEKLKAADAEAAIAATNARLKSALDGAQVNVMLADNDFNIIYMNETMVKMMENAEADIQVDLPNFVAAELMGFNIDGFHTKPSHQRKMVGDLDGTFATSIKIGVRTFDLIANPVKDEDGTRLGTCVEWDDITEKLKEADVLAEVAATNARLKSALDGAKANVMLADNDFNIIYMNETMVAMMKNAEEDIKKELKNFDADNLMGFNIDGFHKDPSHQRKMVGGLTGTFDGRISIGVRTFDLIANPVMDEHGTRLGTSVEWEDITQKLQEAEILAELAASNSRIKTSLDGAKANVMIADPDFNIIYMNTSMVAMMRNAESDIRKDLPNFSTDTLMGFNIDGFHKDPSHQRRMVGSLTSTFETRIIIGGRSFDLIANPVNDDEGNRLGTSVEWDDCTDRLATEAAAAAIANENAQIKIALDKVTANVMVANADMEISYMNDSMVAMFADAEADIKKVLPRFEASKLMGNSPDIFHKNPAHQRNMIGALAGTHSTEIAVGERKFTLIANPVHSEDGERLGTVIEWGDVTIERNVEIEINDVVEAAVAGDLTQRIEIEDKTGFMKNVSIGINSFAEVCEAGLNDVGRMLKAMAAGDLTNRITADYQGTFDELKTNANASAEKLSEVLLQIMVGSGEVSNASTEIASGSADLSQRTEQQASSLEETAASMEEMEGAVKINADNANEANKQGTAAREVAVKGGTVVENAVEAMSRIEESSRKISDIIVVIDEIAFQTNLLALNAAVEAARAGDAGKGFAVVASEVRALAQRSSEAAKDIKSLIVDSNNQVSTGVELVNEAGSQLGQIVTSISQVTDLVSEIAAANQEQATGIAEINRAIAEMDDMTQQNSALVEETAASARQLEEQSDVMQERVAFFKVGDGGGTRDDGRGGTPLDQVLQSKPKTKAKARKNAPKKGKAAKAGAGGDDDWAEF